MSSSFYALSPPPQTLESTGEWGDIDSLLWSLDDPRVIRRVGGLEGRAQAVP